MRSRPRIMRWLACAAALVVMLILAGSAFAQSDNSGNFTAAAALGGFMVVFLIIGLAVYVYMALALQTIANKTNTENAWLAWVPIINIILMLNIAKKPLWWIILCLIPIVNIIVIVIVWMAIAEARGKPSWWGILFIVPVVQVIVPGYLAWAD
jgi:cytochrome bd-type quinol oxidase subunit 2